MRALVTNPHMCMGSIKLTVYDKDYACQPASHDLTSTTSKGSSVHSKQLISASLTLKNEALCLSINGFHSFGHCSHISFSKGVLLHEVLDTCQVLPIVLRLQRDLGREEGEHKKRAVKRQGMESGTSAIIWKGTKLSYVEQISSRYAIFKCTLLHFSRQDSTILSKHFL